MARRAWSIINFMLRSRLAASMKTSLFTVRTGSCYTHPNVWTYNSSRQRIGEPIAFQSARRRQIKEYDFSPPDSVLVFLISPPFTVRSGCTCRCQLPLSTMLYGHTYHNVHPLVDMINQEVALEGTFRKHFREGNTRCQRDRTSKFFPAFLAIGERSCERLSLVSTHECMVMCAYELPPSWLGGYSAP